MEKKFTGALLLLAMLCAALYATPVSAEVCSVTSDVCDNICEKYERRAPRPWIQDWCKQGCTNTIQALEIGTAKKRTQCSRVCRKAPSPRPTLFNSCVDGCSSAHTAYAACEENKIAMATAQTVAGANAATATADMFSEDTHYDERSEENSL